MFTTFLIGCVAVAVYALATIAFAQLVKAIVRALS